MQAVSEGLARDFPATNAGRSIAVEPLQGALIGRELQRTSVLFIGVVGFILLICCANVANLLLARASARTRELAIRSALGADRSRVTRQMLTESLLLSTLGAALGLALGAVILEVAPAVIPPTVLPPAVSLTFDVRVVVFCALTALLVGLLFGLAPAWQATRLSLAQATAADSRTATGSNGRMRSALVVGEVAAAVLLLFGAGLLLRTLMAVENVDRGYQVESALTMIVDPLDGRYPSQDALVRFFDTIAEEVRAAPGVRSVAWASTVPLGSSYVGRWLYDIEGRPPLMEREHANADYQIVSASYFSTVDLPVVEGRAFSDRDTRDGIPVCIVNEALVRLHFADESPIGRRIALRQTAERPAVVREIVGVARQVKERPDEIEELVQVYVPISQHAVGDMFLIVRPASGQAEALTPAVRAVIGRVDREQLVSVRNVMTLDDVARDATSRYRFRAVLVVTFAVLALTLAMVGVSGILAYSVQRRLREFGVRRALGATTADLVRLVSGAALRVVASGAGIGLALSALFGRLLTAMLFGVEPVDLVTFAMVMVALLLTVVVAAAGPAWRAIRVDPAVALRGE